MHEIDFSNNRANIAVARGVEPWHGYGNRVNPYADIGTWRRESGLTFEVLESNVQFVRADGSVVEFPNRKALYRDDTYDPLGLVSHGFKVVQPSVIVEFFRELCDINGFTMEVMGSLRKGARIWGLAKVGDGAIVIGQDKVDPYVLLCTGYDGTLATHGKFTTVQVVCNNTLEMAMFKNDDKELGELLVSKGVRVNHRQTFDAKALRMQLGIAKDAFEKFMLEAQLLASREASPRFAKEFLKELLPQPPKDKDGNRKNIEEMASFQRMLQLCVGGDKSVPHDPAAVGSMWGMLSGITYYVDHESGYDSNRLNSAWFGVGNGLKNKARAELMALIEA